MRRIQKYGVVFGIAKGSIVGAAGLRYRKTLWNTGRPMGETHGGYVDITAAKCCTTAFADAGFDIDTKKSRKSKGRKKVLKRMKEVQKNQITI